MTEREKERIEKLKAEISILKNNLQESIRTTNIMKRAYAQLENRYGKLFDKLERVAAKYQELKLVDLHSAHERIKDLNTYIFTIMMKKKDYREVLQELVDIIDDKDARKEIDSFTTQPARKLLGEKK